MTDRARWIGLVAALYVASGLPFGVVNELAPIWLKANGTGLKELGLVTLVGLPWTFKVLWAPAIDRSGWPAPWIVLSLAVVAIGTAALPWAPDLRWIAVLLVLIAVASATQDVAIDGASTAFLPKDLHGRANGVRVAAYRAAMLLAGGVGAMLSSTIGWAAVFLGLGAVAAALIPVAWRVPRVTTPTVTLSQWLRELVAWVGRDGVVGLLALVGFVLWFKVGDAAMAPMAKAFWQDAGLKPEEVGFVTVTLGTGLTVLGAVVGGEIATRIGLFRALWTLGLVQALSNLGYWAAAVWPSRPALYGASIVESFTSGLGTAAYLAFLMRACRGDDAEGSDQAATRFALMTALAGFTRTVAGALSGFATEEWGYDVYFAFTFVIALPAFALLPFVRRRVETA